MQTLRPLLLTLLLLETLTDLNDNKATYLEGEKMKA